VERGAAESQRVILSLETLVQLGRGVTAPLADVLACADPACPTCKGRGRFWAQRAAGKKQLLCSCSVANYRRKLEHAPRAT